MVCQDEDGPGDAVLESQYGVGMLPVSVLVCQDAKLNGRPLANRLGSRGKRHYFASVSPVSSGSFESKLKTTAFEWSRTPHGNPRFFDLFAPLFTFLDRISGGVIPSIALSLLPARNCHWAFICTKRIVILLFPWGSQSAVDPNCIQSTPFNTLIPPFEGPDGGLQTMFDCRRHTRKLPVKMSCSPNLPNLKEGPNFAFSCLPYFYFTNLIINFSQRKGKNSKNYCFYFYFYCFYFSFRTGRRNRKV